MKWFALVMSGLYVVAGCLLLFTDALPMIDVYRQGIGGVLLGYGLLRGVMWYRKDRRSGQEEA